MATTKYVVTRVYNRVHSTFTKICLDRNHKHNNDSYVRLLVGKPEGKRPLGRSRRRWMNNIKMSLAEIGWDGVDWTGLAQDRDKWRALVKWL
jgi:hypothetical protein